MCARTFTNFLIVYFAFISVLNVKGENVLVTEVFEIVINPSMFNWTYEGDPPDQFVYQPSLLDAPDLPSWINYVYSNKHHVGYLYGVPPEKEQHIILEIIALNRNTYETKRVVLPIYITQKRYPAKYEVQLKIDNLNVEDMFDVERMERLKDVFRKQLWKDSDEDLYVTFLASAIELGARLPLNPKEGEGVVLRLGSQSPLSMELQELQEEVKPLWKRVSCPRDYKRTTVERFFRDAGFVLDWCAFRLLDDNSSAMQHSQEKVENPSSLLEQKLPDNKWVGIARKDVPQRNYTHEFLVTILVPMFIMTLLAIILSLILCFHHEGISKEMVHVPIGEMTQYATINRVTYTLRSLSNQRDFACLSPEMYAGVRSHTNSPTSTISRGVHCRPSPPPYVKPKFSAEF
ncbi:epsilon-sarcoglycan isoform X2 [Onthophagus taurus]|uniref:epsilon-sarcoglycan isoform X2 n=1 Tax=Onthophagus taurus TaxID=166361 RepID=UPI000C2060A1|nr:epsilon-sarcoglycan isoform X1 [Onthophagus taurus]